MENNYDILPFRPEWAASLRAIWNWVIENEDSFVFTQSFTKAEFDTLLVQQTEVHCALCGGEVAGFYILHPNLPGRAGHVANASYAVSPRHRGQGLGRQLAVHSLAAAQKAGFSILQFNAVVADNIAATHLWRSLGFTPVGQVPGAFIKRDGSPTGLNLYYIKL